MDQKKNPNKQISKVNDWYKPDMYSCKVYYPVTPQCFINIVKNYCSSSILNYSDWIDCTSLDKYYYFVENLGSSDVEAYIEISPDRNLVYRDSDQIIIKSSQVSYFQPLRESRYIRFSFRNLNSAGTYLINAWFQGKKH